MFFKAEEKEEVKEPQKAMRRHLTCPYRSSETLTRHNNRQILTLSAPVSSLCVRLAEQTAGLPQHRLSSWQDLPPSATPTDLVCSYSTAFSMWGAPGTSKQTMWELQWGWQAATAQRSSSAQHRGTRPFSRLGVDWVTSGFHYRRETDSGP